MGFLVMAATGLLLALGSILFGAMIDRRRRGVASEPEVRRIVYGYAALCGTVIMLALANIWRLLASR